MKKVYAFLANGSEEVECLAVVDLLRRAGIETVTVSVEAEREIVSSHKLRIVCDETMEAFSDFSDADVLFLPGGMPGTLRLGECKKLTEALTVQAAAGKHIAAICAAPSILGGLGLLKGKRATCFPGFEEALCGASYESAGVVTDGTVTTAKGLGYAIDLGLALVGLLEGQEKASELKKAIQYERS